MAGGRAGTGVSDHRQSRRYFFKLLAGSPMLALAYPGLPPSWQRAVQRELRRSPVDAPAGRSECGEPMGSPDRRRPRPQRTPGAAAQPPGALDEHLTGQLVESPEDAINVWDFERVAHANTL